MPKYYLIIHVQVSENVLPSEWQILTRIQSNQYSFISLLAASFTYDAELFNGKSTRQPNSNQFIDGICEQLQQAIEIYEKTPLS